LLPASTVGCAAGDGVSGEEEVAMAAGLGSLTIRPAKRSAGYREGRHYTFSPRHSCIHVCSSTTKKVCHVPRLLQRSVQPNAREESENEVRKWWFQCSPQLIHLQYQRYQTQHSLHEGNGRRLTRIQANTKSLNSVCKTNMTFLSIPEGLPNGG